MRTLKPLFARPGFCLGATALACVIATGHAAAQGADEPVGGPLTLTPVLNAPFVADMSVTISQTGTVKKATARYFRDSKGRVRIEYQAPGSPARSTNVPMIIVNPEPGGRLVYTIDPVARTFRLAPTSVERTVFNGGATVSIPIAPTRFRQYVGAEGLRGDVVADESLGTRVISGVTTTGRRLLAGNDERWESHELRMVIYSHRIDTATGADIEYRLTNITRTEPPSDLFVVPEDLTQAYQGSKEDPSLGITWKD